MTKTRHIAENTSILIALPNFGGKSLLFVHFELLKY